MSFRELRNFSEVMRTLGYRRLISLDNFRTPNFELVADVLYWLVHRYDPAVDLSDDITTEQARVHFLQSVARIVMQKARIKLNIKQLYRADGYAVQELLKVCTLLANATKTNASAATTTTTTTTSTTATPEQLAALKSMRGIATDIVDSGSKLYALLADEDALKPQRQRALRFLDTMSLDLENNTARDMVDRAVRQQINVVSDRVAQLEQTCAALEEDQLALQSKIEKKQYQIGMAETRLKSLKQVRPAYMEEYEALEEELRVLYDEYVVRVRNLQYLEGELERHREAERQLDEQRSRALKLMQRRFKDEEKRMLSRLDDEENGGGGGRGRRGRGGGGGDGSGKKQVNGGRNWRPQRPGEANAARRSSARLGGRLDDDDINGGGGGGGGGGNNLYAGNDDDEEDDDEDGDDYSDEDEDDDDEEEEEGDDYDDDDGEDGESSGDSYF